MNYLLLLGGGHQRDIYLREDRFTQTRFASKLLHYYLLRQVQDALINMVFIKEGIGIIHVQVMTVKFGDTT